VPILFKEHVMRRMILPWMLLIAVGCQPGATTLTDEDIAAIRSLGTSYAEANLAKDADAVAAVYATDAIEMPPNRPAIVGVEAIRASYQSAFESGMESTEFTVTSVAIDGMNGLAFDRGTWSWTGTPPGMSEPVTETGKYLTIARRQEDGSWLWTADIWNSDTPIPEPQ
jgi:uncharacterized protein (TIGR02246 family)